MWKAVVVKGQRFGGMAVAEPRDTKAQLALYKDLAIVLYRIAKFDEASPDQREWGDAQQDFMRRARRLAKALERHGYELTKSDSPPVEYD